MEKNTVVLHLERYHQLIEIENAVNDGIKFSISVQEPCFKNSFVLLTNDKMVKKISETVNFLKERYKNACKSDIDTGKKYAQMQHDFLELQRRFKEMDAFISDLKRMSIIQFIKFRKQ
jgi:hypothetical protein